MLVGLVAFELNSSSAKKAKAKVISGADSLGEVVRKNWDQFLKARPSNVKFLLIAVAVYLVVSRSGPLLIKVGENAVEKFHLNVPLEEILKPEGLQSLKEGFRGFTRVPGPISSRRSFSVIYFVMGTPNSKSDDKKPAEDAGPKSDYPVVPKQAEEESSKPSADSSDKKYVKYCEIEDTIKSGSLAILKRAGQDIHHYAVFIQYDRCNPDFPTMLVKGKTKPMMSFDPNVPRHAHIVTAASRIFYGDYEEVSVHHLKEDLPFGCAEMTEFVDKIATIKFSDAELAAIDKAKSPQERSAIVCTFMIAQYYSLLKVLKAEPDEVAPGKLQESLDLEPPMYLELPKVKEGPVASGDPPFLSKLVDGIMPPPNVNTHTLSSLLPKLNTGDLVLFSGATSSGAIIKFFDNAEFSHIAIVVKTQYSSQVLIWEASTNKAGLVDIESGEVRRGVELLPLRSKVFSGWYNRVAIRRLTGISDEKRDEMSKELLLFRKEVQGRPYEKSNLELIRSALDFQEEYLSFLKNSKEDLSSLFCSELVAEAYKRMHLIETDKHSNEFTPDDFSSHTENTGKLKLVTGKLEKEEYVELKFDLFADGTGTMER